MRLIDRADGISGRFCIARDSVLYGAPYCQFYNEEDGWGSAGTVYVGEVVATEKMNRIKIFEESLRFPKKEQMTSKEYVSGCLMTESPCTDEVDDRMVDCGRLLHAGIGMSTESGEILDQLKKHIYYGRALDKVNLVEEVGDLFFYAAIACDVLDVTFEEVMVKNKAKLAARYGEKFSSEAAINRDLEKERSILEGSENGTA